MINEKIVPLALQLHSRDSCNGHKLKLDPHKLLFLNGWLELVPHIEFIAIFRHPIVVARSMHARKTLSISIQRGLKLWQHYNQCLLKQLRKTAFPLLSFDWPED